MVTNETSPFTALDAVNTILQAIGKRAAIDLVSTGGSVVRDEALKTLEDTSREVQSSGWWFNDEADFPIDPDQDGEIAIPPNTLEVKAIKAFPTKDLVFRGSRLYDRKGHTFKIDEKVEVDIVFALPFEDLPQVAKWYITVKAARRFALAKLPNLDTFRFSQIDEDEALGRLQGVDASIDSRTLKNANRHVAKMLKR